jgi:hypothetical protein
MAKKERKTIRVELRAWVLCDVEVSMGADGQAEIHRIAMSTRGNLRPTINIESTALSEEEYEAVDEAARKAFGVTGESDDD